MKKNLLLPLALFVIFGFTKLSSDPADPVKKVIAGINAKDTTEILGAFTPEMRQEFRDMLAPIGGFNQMFLLLGNEKVNVKIISVKITSPTTAIVKATTIVKQKGKSTKETSDYHVEKNENNIWLINDLKSLMKKRVEEAH